MTKAYSRNEEDYYEDLSDHEGVPAAGVKGPDQ